MLVYCFDMFDTDIALCCLEWHKETVVMLRLLFIWVVYNVFTRLRIILCIFLQIMLSTWTFTTGERIWIVSRILYYFLAFSSLGILGQRERESIKQNKQKTPMGLISQDQMKVK